MPTDAKLGLLLGVGLVLTTAVIFFRKEPSEPIAPTAAVSAAVAPLPHTGQTPAVSLASTPVAGTNNKLVSRIKDDQ